MTTHRSLRRLPERLECLECTAEDTQISGAEQNGNVSAGSEMGRITPMDGAGKIADARMTSRLTVVSNAPCWSEQDNE